MDLSINAFEYGWICVWMDLSMDAFEHEWICVWIDLDRFEYGCICVWIYLAYPDPDLPPDNNAGHVRVRAACAFATRLPLLRVSNSNKHSYQ